MEFHSNNDKNQTYTFVALTEAPYHLGLVTEESVGVSNERFSP